MEQTLAERSYDYIREKLKRGELPPGKRLVNRVLASEIGVSVIPVREAIHRLASEGFIDHVPGSGAFVRKTDPQDIDDLYVLRDALESCAAGEAARYITEHQLDELNAILSEAEKIAAQISKRPKQHATKTQMNAWLDTEQRFHQLVFEAARNQLLAKVSREHRAIGQIFDAQRDDPQLLTSDVATSTVSGKRDLIDAFQKRDHQQARELMSQQIQRGRKEVLRHLRTVANR
ncbi:GntR family transcriptional regulator [Rubripirellula reticaptiva]|uniref:Putative HTH-type transcriptional regulator YdfH n=1 Tax=Rubripirellula reticaptiva TaxID=2528013 RepID=A0A5C6EL61_9BACT|nr:GntR family transcriptional regulator [Rubripirellula reticaptiva]TWU49230.1 putative HTH-type transcriptional regulator YdfH [Rubripirellula reticaptiva]